MARLGRSLASLRGDDTWYEAATRSLIECKPETELPLLWVELARLRLAQHDEASAAKATGALRSLPDGAWLGRVLDGLTSGASTEEGADEKADSARARKAVEELAESVTDPHMRRSLAVVCALRAHADGDTEATVRHLERARVRGRRRPARRGLPRRPAPRGRRSGRGRAPLTRRRRGA